MNKKPEITWSELSALPDVQKGCEHLHVALEQLRTHGDLVRVLSRYVHFNAPFGAGVAHLASAVAQRPDLFGDPNTIEHYLSDRSYEVAAPLFAAAIDEFGGESAKYQPHRTLAQNTVQAVGKFFGYNGASFKSLIDPNAETIIAMEGAKSGYGIGQVIDENALFQNMGFHIGSEQLAGEEFRIIDTFLRREHPALVSHMEMVDPEISDVQTYIWIALHTTVEDEHAELAFRAANLALRYYRGDQEPYEMRKQIVKGFVDFVKLQTEFLESIGK